MPATNAVTITVLFSLFLLSHATNDDSASISAVDPQDDEPHRTVVVRPAEPTGPIDPDLVTHSFRRHGGMIGPHLHRHPGRDLSTEIVEIDRNDKIELDGEEKKQIVKKKKKTPRKESKNDDDDDGDDDKLTKKGKVEMKECDGEFGRKKMTKKCREFKHEKEMKKQLKKKKKMKLRKEKEIDTKLKPIKESKVVFEDELKVSKHKKRMKKKKTRNAVEPKESKPSGFVDRVRHFFKHLF